MLKLRELLLLNKEEVFNLSICYVKILFGLYKSLGFFLIYLYVMLKLVASLKN